MTISEVIKPVIDSEKVRVQRVDECITNATAVNRKGDNPAHTKITLATTAMTPGDLMGKPAMVGLILWIPRELYESTLDN